ncbi:MAG: methyltransferase domain-containing protein [Flavobacteriales bacterium]|nr:methyltransferase domain-containing protein [Flavobacteriales bacterium]
MTSTKKFWDKRYQDNDIGWDVGEITTPLKTYFNQLEDKLLSILIPGAGNSYEAEYLHKLGFTNVIVVDIAPTVIDKLKKRVPDFPTPHIINMNFFDLTGQFDLIIEQTFFCAINPSLRANYAKQAHHLLKPNGKIVGLMFNAPLNETHPPYGGDCKEYHSYFNPYFDIQTMEEAYNSIESRAKREVFVKMVKKEYSSL